MSLTNRQAKRERIAQLPELQQGITLLTVDSNIKSPIHALAVDHILCSGGDAVWIDPGTHAQTGPLVEFAPADRILDRIRVARAFTPFQHLDLLRSLPGLLTDQSRLVLLPQIDRYYREDGLLADEGRDLFLSGIASVATAAREHDISVLVTRRTEDSFSAPIETTADHRLHCETTPFGPRFRTDEEETLVYPVKGGRSLQTTLSFWKEILSAREPLYESSFPEAGSSQEVSIRGSN